MKFPNKRHIEDINNDFFHFSEFSNYNLGKNINTNISENDAEFTLEIKLLGFDKDEISIYIEDELLIIEGKREDFIDEETENYIKQESDFSFFQKYVPIQGIVKKEIKAYYNNETITIHLPKTKNSNVNNNNIELE